MSQATSRDPLLVTFPVYIELWQMLDVEYHRTPSWRWIRLARLQHRMHMLTKDYERWFRENYIDKKEGKS